MLMKVISQDGQERTIPSYRLNMMIRKKEIIAFRRSDGWVEIGEQPVRKRQRPLDGPGQRRDDVLLQGVY